MQPETRPEDSRSDQEPGSFEPPLTRDEHEDHLEASFAADRPRRDDSVGVLLKRLANDVATLFSKEMALARSEFSHAVGDAKRGVTSLATGGAVLYAGFLFLLGAAFLGLNQVVSPWLSALIVGGVTAVIGYIMVSSGRKKLEPGAFRMERTTESLQRDKQMAQGRAR
jgi:hypothetical protein